MVTRDIIEIDRNKCNGCALCTTACAEGALEIDTEGKAVLVREIFCDGLGACLNICPTGALQVIKKESADYDAKATHDHVLQTRGTEAAKHVHQPTPTLGCGCPGSMAREIKRKVDGLPSGVEATSELSQWPIQLQLVSPQSPYFNESDLLIAADCTAFTIGSFHQDLLKGKKLAIACPKLDDTDTYVNKIAEILQRNTIYSLTVAIMTVPCCSGLMRIVQEAVQKSGKNIAIRKVVIDLDGSIKK